MKKAVLLQSELSYVISKMGHMDQLAIGDAGLPIPGGVQRIDLAVTQGVPTFLSVFEAVLTELKIEAVILAEETRTRSELLHSQILESIHKAEAEGNTTIRIDYVSHESFKGKTKDCKAVVRTGEFTPYANIILVSGVVF